MELSLPSLSLFDMEDHSFEFQSLPHPSEDGVEPPPPPQSSTDEPASARSSPPSPTERPFPKPPRKRTRIFRPREAEKVKRRLVFDEEQSQSEPQNQEDSDETEVLQKMSEPQNKEDSDDDEPEESQTMSDGPNQEDSDDEPEEPQESQTMSDGPNQEDSDSDEESQIMSDDPNQEDSDDEPEEPQMMFDDPNQKESDDEPPNQKESSDSDSDDETPNRKKSEESQDSEVDSKRRSEGRWRDSYERRRRPDYESPFVRFKKHVNVLGTLAVRDDGYTVTNGPHSLSSPHFYLLSKDIFNLRIRKLYPVDATSHALWKRHRTSYVESEVMDERRFAPCSFCRKAECHRWMVTQAHHLYPAVRHDRRHTWHYTPAAICVTPSGFTVSNGLISAHRDGCPTVSDIAEVVSNMRVSRLFFVDEYTASKCAPLCIVPTRKMVWDDDAGRCAYCHSAECHRWRAVVGGIARLLKYPVDPIEH